MKPSGERVAPLVVALAAAIAISPLVFHGPSYGHDFNFHLLNWMEAARQFSHGNLYPRWAYSPAYNAGEPRFVFYPPLSWALGALLGLVLTHCPGISAESAWTAVPIAYTWLCLTISGLMMYGAGRKFAGATAAVIAAVVYVVNPYMLFTAYERTAFAELLAAAWMPLLLVAALRERLRAREVAVAIALLWLTNAPAAVIGCYLLVLLVILRAAFASNSPGSLHRVTRDIALPAAAGLVLGVGVAGFYFIPAAWERQFVQLAMATVVDMRIDHNFLFEHTGTSADAVIHDAVLRTASWVAVALLLGAVAALNAIWVRERASHSMEREARRFPMRVLLPLLGIIAVLLTPISNSIWQHLPELTFLQFPWRLLTVVAPVLALALSAVLTGLRLNRTATVGAVCVCAGLLSAVAYGPFHQVSEAGQAVPSQLHAFEQNKGTEPIDEYTPQTADNDALMLGNPPYWLADEPTASAPQRLQAGITPHHFVVTTGGAKYLILNLREYPAWRVELNDQITSEREWRDDGLIVLPIAAGTSKVDLRYAHMPDEIVGGVVTLVSVLILVALQIREKHGRA